MGGPLITRREALLMLGSMALVGGKSLRAAITRQGVGPFTPQDVALLDEVAETILPETRTPGAKAAQTGAFMALMVTDSYSDRDQAIFRAGIENLKAAGFMSLSSAQRLALLERLDREQQDHGTPRHYFRMMKELALHGYFTSEIGYTQAQRYVESPGAYEPCVPYTPGERAWAPHA